MVDLRAASEIRLLANPNVDGAKIWRNVAPLMALLFGRIDNLENVDRSPFVLRDEQLPPQTLKKARFRVAPGQTPKRSRHCFFVAKSYNRYPPAIGNAPAPSHFVFFRNKPGEKPAQINFF
jgi:hypothetical protein